MPNRRSFLATSFLAAPGFAAASTGFEERPARPLKIVCVGGHPDDPESGCGGTLALFAAAGHKVTIVYLTRGERGIEGKSLDEAARIRTAEAQRACEILAATPVFAGQIDGATELNADRVRTFIELLTKEQPDIVLTHWPVDTHMDHQVASLLAFRAWLALQQSFSLFYFEVNAGEQTKVFLPTEYVDITPVRDQKKRALFAHVSQDGEGIYRDHHGPMAQFRGREIGVAAAEAFVHAARSRLPGV
jgi:LmbE family N-acetylglucosaminyl deacetylase